MGLLLATSDGPDMDILGCIGAAGYLIVTLPKTLAVFQSLQSDSPGQAARNALFVDNDI
jgi:hypothetical protein